MQKIPQEHLEALLESEKQEAMGKVEYLTHEELVNSIEGYSQILTKRKLYRIIYSNAFHKELSSIVNYILYALHNRNAARRLYKSVIGTFKLNGFIP